MSCAFLYSPHEGKPVKFTSFGNYTEIRQDARLTHSPILVVATTLVLLFLPECSHITSVPAVISLMTSPSALRPPFNLQLFSLLLRRPFPIAQLPRAHIYCKPAANVVKALTNS